MFLKNSENKNFISLHKKAVDFLTDGFKNLKTDDPDKALSLLQELFQNFSIDFLQFCQQCRLSRKEMTDFLSYLLYEIYYNEQFFSSSPLDPWILTVLLAEALDEKSLRKVLSALDEQQQLSLIAYCLLNMREGAWLSLNLLKNLHSKSKDWHQLIHLLQINYYDPFQFYLLLHQDSSQTIQHLTTKLEANSQENVKKIHQLFPSILNLVINIPMSGLKAIEEMSLQNPPGVPESEMNQLKENTLKAQENIEKIFGPSAKESYSQEEMTEFFRVFGLFGYFLDLPLTMNFSSLVQILEIIHRLLQVPQVLPISQISVINIFILYFSQQLYAFHRRPQQYVAGLNRLVYSVPTKGTSFDTKPWLKTTLNGLTTVFTHLAKKGIQHIHLNDYPIIIFDQSNNRQLTKNRNYTQQCAKTYHANIWHLSKDQILQLAKKLDVAHWIKTNAKGSGFGYGGSRNCVYFLAPVIYKLARKGLKTIEEIMALDKKELQKAYSESVLGNNGTDIVLHVSEDDLAMPESNFFNDALFVNLNQESYFRRLPYNLGRDTIRVNPFLSLNQVIEEPSNIFFPNVWIERPKPVMRGFLSKPCFCLPLSLGNEENDVNVLEYRFDFFLHPYLHLGGTRYPKGKIPHTPLDNVLNHLKTHLVYAVQLTIKLNLIDPENKIGRCILPWNTLEKTIPSRFQNLGELMDFISKPETIQSLRDKFWQNMAFVFENSTENIDPLYLPNVINRYIHTDFSVDVSEEIKEFYREVKLDAEMFMALGKKSLKMSLRAAAKAVEAEFKSPISKSPLTNSLKTLITRIQSFPAR